MLKLRHVRGGEAEVCHQGAAHGEVGMVGGEGTDKVDDLGLVAQQVIEGASQDSVGFIVVSRRCGVPTFC